MANARPPQKRDFKTVVEDAKALATVLASEAEAVFGRRAARVLGVVALFAVGVALLLVLLNWFISPDTAQERQGLALVLAIGLGGGAAIVGLYFTRQTLINTQDQEADRAREAAVRAREVALRACLGQLGRLLTNDKWSNKDKEGDTDDTLRRLARAEVLSVLGTLDGPRKRILVRFLYESDLLFLYESEHPERLSRLFPGIDLSGADLRDAYLESLTLSNAYLSGIRLGGANLESARLDGADLSGSDLRDLDPRNLSYGSLFRTKLSRANLSGTSLIETDLSGVDLSNTRSLTQEQIEQAVGDTKTSLPDYLQRPERWRKSAKEPRGEV